jgi:O-antigen ligase
VRVGGPFFDFELLSEYCAINLLLVTLWVVRAQSMTRRIAYSLLLVLVTFTLFATVTRGAFIALFASLAYLTWILRRRIRLVPFTILVSAIVAGFLAMDFYVTNFTRSGDVLARLMGTEFVGIVPESRTLAWRDGWERLWEHPLIGHGPYYSSQTGTRTWYWPHNAYLLIANLVGLIGLGFFLTILVQLWRITRPTVDRLTGPSYAKAFLVVAHVQLVLFIIDQTKIEFLRNPIYQFQVWLMFASFTAAYMVARQLDATERAPA